jgi:hypothetical protein
MRNGNDTRNDRVWCDLEWFRALDVWQLQNWQAPQIRHSRRSPPLRTLPLPNSRIMSSNPTSKEHPPAILLMFSVHPAGL